MAPNVLVLWYATGAAVPWRYGCVACGRDAVALPYRRFKNELVVSMLGRGTLRAGAVVRRWCRRSSCHAGVACSRVLWMWKLGSSDCAGRAAGAFLVAGAGAEVPEACLRVARMFHNLRAVRESSVA